MEQIALGPEKIVVGAGVYTEITEIVAPSSAMAGSRVDVNVKIKNKYSASILIMAVVIIDGVYFERDNEVEYWVPAGATHSFLGHFTMPNKAVTITAHSYYKSADGYYYLDDERTKSVKLVEYPSADIRNLAVVITAVEYPSADIRNLAVKITAVEYPSADIRNLAVKITAVEYPSADIKDLEVVITAAEYPKADIKDIEVVITGGLPPGAELFQNLKVTYKKL